MSRFILNNHSFNHSNKAMSIALSYMDLRRKISPFLSAGSTCSLLRLSAGGWEPTNSAQVKNTHFIGRPCMRSLNKRNEFISKCCHRDRIILKNFWVVFYVFFPLSPTHVKFLAWHSIFLKTLLLTPYLKGLFANFKYVIIFSISTNETFL